MTNPDQYDEQAAALLPCADKTIDSVWCNYKATHRHTVGCAAYRIPAVAQAIRDRDAEVGRFQDQIRDRLIRDYKLPDDSIDGAGSDSDEIDFTMDEIGQAISQIEEAAEQLGYDRGAQAIREARLPQRDGEEPAR